MSCAPCAAAGHTSVAGIPPTTATTSADASAPAGGATFCYALFENAKRAGVDPRGYVLEATRHAIASSGAVTLSEDVTKFGSRSDFQTFAPGAALGLG